GIPRDRDEPGARAEVIARAQAGACLLALALAADCRAAASCAATIGELRNLLDDASFPLERRETSMDDGKPLVLSLLERNGARFFAFVKTEDGLWAEGASVVCRSGIDLQARFLEDQVRLGPAANVFVRSALAGGAQFTLKVSAEQLRIEASGWSGVFAGRRASGGSRDMK